MGEHGFIEFGELVGKLELLRVGCDACGRFGSYSVKRLIAAYGPQYSVVAFREQLIAACPRQLAGRYDDQCRCCFPELPAALRP